MSHTIRNEALDLNYHFNSDASGDLHIRHDQLLGFSMHIPFDDLVRIFNYCGFQITLKESQPKTITQTLDSGESWMILEIPKNPSMSVKITMDYKDYNEAARLMNLCDGYSAKEIESAILEHLGDR